MNVLLAVLLYVVAFMAGVRFEDATVGNLRPGAAAAVARSLEAGVPDGLHPGDRIESIGRLA